MNVWDSKKEENSSYLSLLEATEFCDYSQKYLNLRARQGKLRAVKLGRNWFTTREWLNEYLCRVEEYHTNGKKKELQREIIPPNNLPVEPIAEAHERSRFGALVNAGKVGVGVIVFLAFTTGAAYGKGGIAPLYRDFSETALHASLVVRDEAERLALALRHISFSIENDLRQAAKDTSLFASRAQSEASQAFSRAQEDALEAQHGASYLVAQASSVSQPYFSWLQETLLSLNRSLETSLSRDASSLTEKITRTVAAPLSLFAKKEAPRAETEVRPPEEVRPPAETEVRPPEEVRPPAEEPGLRRKPDLNPSPPSPFPRSSLLSPESYLSTKTFSLFEKTSKMSNPSSSLPAPRERRENRERRETPESPPPLLAMPRPRLPPSPLPTSPRWEEALTRWPWAAEL